MSGNDQILCDKVNNIHVVKPTGRDELLCRLRCRCRSADEQTVDTVVHQFVVVDLSAHTIIIGSKRASLLEPGSLITGFLKATGGSTDRCVSTLSNLVERDRWPQTNNLNGIDQLLNRIDQHIATTTEANLCVVNPIQKDAFIF